MTIRVFRTRSSFPLEKKLVKNLSEKYKKARGEQKAK